MKILKVAMLALTISALAVSPAFAETNLSFLTPDGTSLNVVATAQPQQVCLGQSTQLFVVATGGTNNYTFIWTSDPPGFNASSTDAMVTPAQTTVYTVIVNDGQTTATASVTVTVHPLPAVEITPLFNPNIRVANSGQISVCVFDSVTLDAGNPGSTYAWNNGSTEQRITAQSSGISYDLQDYSVTVTDPATGCSNSSNLSVEFTFTDCTYGIPENTGNNLLKVYPNPSKSGIFELEFGNSATGTELKVFSSQGLLVKSELVSTADKNRSHNIDLSNQPAGIYYLRTSFSNQKLIILR